MAVLAVLVLALALTGCLGQKVPPETPMPSPDHVGLVYYLPMDGLIAGAIPYIHMFENEAITYNIPDYEDTITTSSQKIAIEIKNMDITNFIVGDPALTPIPSSNTIYGVITDSYFGMNFDYTLEELSFPYKTESGTGSIIAYNVNASTEIDVDFNSESGGLRVNFDYFDIEIGNLVIDVSGGTIANIISIFDDALEKLISSTIRTLFDKFVDEYLNDMLDEVSETGYFNCSEDVSCIDLRFVKSPLVDDNGLYLYYHALSYNIKHPDEVYDLEYYDLPKRTSKYLLNIEISNVVFQSLLDTLDIDHFFSLRNSNGWVEPITISYSDIINYYPEWQSLYPSGTNGKLSLVSTEVPTSEIMYTGLRITIPTHMELVPDGITDQTSISSDVSLVFLGDFWWMDYHNNKGADIITNYGKLTIELSYVSVSKANNSITDSFCKYVIDSYYLKQVNDHLEKNYIYIMEMEGNIYTSPNISYESDCVFITANIEEI